MKAISAIACSFLISACVATQTRQNTTFQQEINSIRESFDLPGLTAAIVTNDGTTITAHAGFADKETQQLITDNSRILAASIGKTFVAALCLQLASEGKLNLDQPISQWVGDRAWFAHLANHDLITMRHLLTHSAGLPDHVYTEAFANALRTQWQQQENPKNYGIQL